MRPNEWNSGISGTCGKPSGARARINVIWEKMQQGKTNLLELYGSLPGRKAFEGPGIGN